MKNDDNKTKKHIKITFNSKFFLLGVVIIVLTLIIFSSLIFNTITPPVLRLIVWSTLLCGILSFKIKTITDEDLDEITNDRTVDEIKEYNIDIDF